MAPQTILACFIGLRLLKTAIELALSLLNRSYYENPKNQKEALELLDISSEEFQKALTYSRDKHKFYLISQTINEALFLTFLAFGGFGFFEQLSLAISHQVGGQDILTGLLFLGLLGLASSLVSLPFDAYSTFSIEQRHGFNRQTVSGFFIDRLKGSFIGILLGGPLLAALLWIMANVGSYWWFWAFVVMTAFSLFASFIYPTLLAPLFNKFSQIEDDELKESIYSLAKKINFKASGIFVMDASKRTSHGNAYFTGVFSKKRIVLFDTLISTLKNDEIVAVLAHELGHFKLNHVRLGLLRSFVISGLTFYCLNLCLPQLEFYQAFFLSGISNHAALVVFSLWFGLFDFILTPIGSYISRKNEFAADRFAVDATSSGQKLISALKKLRQTSHSMPLSHPLFSAIYYSHPPLLERLRELGRLSKASDH